MPTCNITSKIERCLHSLLLQSFNNFELLIINDGDSELISQYINELNDPRIRLVCNNERLGLAESLNKGIKLAEGKCIARADADDYYPQFRLQMQYDFLEANPGISLCTNFQANVSPNGNIEGMHCPPLTPEEIKASLLFKCNVCHSSIMLRKNDFIRENLWYDARYQMEDFELWSRAVQKLNFATIDAVLAHYCLSELSVSSQKGVDSLNECQALIICNTLKHLDIHLKEEDHVLLYDWSNPFYPQLAPQKIKLLKRLKKLLGNIYTANEKKHLYHPAALQKVCEKRWLFACLPPLNPFIYFFSQFANKKILLQKIKSTTIKIHTKIWAKIWAKANKVIKSSLTIMSGRRCLKRYLSMLLIRIS